MYCCFLSLSNGTINSFHQSSIRVNVSSNASRIVSLRQKVKMSFLSKSFGRYEILEVATKVNNTILLTIKVSCNKFDKQKVS